MKTFRELRVWQQAHHLALSVYRLTETFPPTERYGLSSQIRRAAVSVAANIVEGHKRRRPKEFLHFLEIADGSLEELKYHALLSRDLGYMNASTSSALDEQAESVGRLLGRFKQYIRQEV